MPKYQVQYTKVFYNLRWNAVGNSGVHGGATRQDGVGIQVLPDVNVTLHDGVVGGLVDAAVLHTQERGLEEGLDSGQRNLSLPMVMTCPSGNS